MPTLDRLTAAPGLAAGNGYAHAVTVTGPLAFLAGQVAADEDGNLVGADDLGAQTHQALANLERILTGLGATWRDVARLDWYVLDASQVQVVRDARDAVLRPALGDQPNPASTLVQVAALFHPDYLVEVDAIVALPDRSPVAGIR